MLTRRELLSALALAGGAAAQAAPAAGMPICAFSKHFQWLSVKDAAALCAELGYDGLDLTLRPGGHIAPERVEDELPKAAEAVRAAGLAVPMVTAGIVDASTPHAEKVIRTLAAQGIRRYRWGGFRYREGVALPKQIDEFKARTHDLAALNRQYGVCAMYHTHSGVNEVGASFWDLFLILKDEDTDFVSVNYDIGHATVEGGYGGWIHSSRLLLPYTRGIAVKDFKWIRDAKGEWIPGWCPMGQGMVNFAAFFKMMKAAGFTGPLQLHMEYPELGGPNDGKSTCTIPKAELLALMRRDIATLKTLLKA